MTAFAFVHTSDLHLGKPFGRMPEDLRGRLIEARHEALGKLAQVARDRGAGHILIAGDTFDTTGPSEQVRRQAAQAMSAAAPVQWWIIPGNHDSLAGEELWRQFTAEAGDNVHVLRDPAPVDMAPGVILLPAPWPRQFPGRDLTEWMVAAETPERAMRIGLAHGGITDFGEDFDATVMVPPDRAATARLDYLALGDWHGALRIGDRTRFSGAPERDGYRAAGRGSCDVVRLSGPGAPAEVETVEIGRFHWSSPELALSPGMDVAAALAALLAPDRAARRDMLLRVEATGFLRMEERGALDEAVRAARPDYGLFELRDHDLATEYEVEDLDLIATGGALRAAVDDLSAEAAGDGEAARVAQAALNRLWSLVREV